MEETKLKVGGCTKFILTVITAALVGLLFKGVFARRLLALPGSNGCQTGKHRRPTGRLPLDSPRSRGNGTVTPGIKNEPGIQIDEMQGLRPRYINIRRCLPSLWGTNGIRGVGVAFINISLCVLKSYMPV